MGTIGEMRVSDPTELDDVGIVVIGRNEGRRLITCLASAKSESDKVIYVDSGSEDGSARTAEQMGALVVRLDRTKPFTAARARNEGFAALRARNQQTRFVHFIDGDCELVPGWLLTALSFIRHKENIAVVCGRRVERHPDMSIYNRLCDREWNSPIGEAFACGGDALMRVEAFELVGGFNPRLIAGEEPELCARLREMGWKIWRLDGAMTIHDAAMNRFSQWWIRAVRSGYGGAEVWFLHKSARFRTYRREIVSAGFWGALLPLAIAVSASIHPLGLSLLLLYPVQVCRIAFILGPIAFQSWVYALFIMLAKFAEVQGILRFCSSFWRRRVVALIEYK